MNNFGNSCVSKTIYSVKQKLLDLEITKTCASAFEKDNFDVTCGCSSTQIFLNRVLINFIQSQNTNRKRSLSFRDYKSKTRRGAYLPPISEIW